MGAGGRFDIFLDSDQKTPFPIYDKGTLTLNSEHLQDRIEVKLMFDLDVVLYSRYTRLDSTRAILDSTPLALYSTGINCN